MNILFLAERIVYGGGEKVRNWLARQLAASGYHVYYATPHKSTLYIEQMKEVGLLGKVEVVEYPFAIKKKRPLSYTKAIKRLYADYQIDLLIIFGGSLVEQLVARKCHVKILLSERCDPSSRKFLSRVLKQIQYRFADKYVFQTPEASKCYGNRVYHKSVVIPNPIIDKVPEPIVENLRKEVVTAGRLSEEKNQKMLISAFSKFHQIHPEYKLVIYGSGPLKDNLYSLIEELKLQDTVSIISGKTNISELINGAELFVLPSNTEGMPNALIEAMSVGLLCITTDCPIYGPRMLVQQGINGYLVPVDDSENLYKQMCIAVDNPDGNLIRKEAIRIRERLASATIYSQWRQIINK